MIIAYTYTDEGEIEKFELTAGDPIPKDTTWIDLLDPSMEEDKYIQKATKIDAPTREEMDKFEVMSPFYKERDSYYMTITAIQKIDRAYPEGIAITFILHPKFLVTLRYSRPKAFSYFSNRALRDAELCSSPTAVLEGLIESMVHSLADALEKTGNEIDQMLIDLFEKPTTIAEQHKRKSKLRNDDDDEEEVELSSSEYYTALIKRVGRAGNLISKVRESLVSINRMLIFFGQIDESKHLSSKELRNQFRNLTREIHSITEYANFLSQRNSFLLDAALGMLNVEQNATIKIFTIAAAMFLPSTLIASIYGMNFSYMPELDWIVGYPMALVLIVASALASYYYFKRKGLL